MDVFERSSEARAVLGMARIDPDKYEWREEPVRPSQTKAGHASKLRDWCADDEERVQDILGFWREYGPGKEGAALGIRAFPVMMFSNGDLIDGYHRIEAWRRVCGSAPLTALVAYPKLKHRVRKNGDVVDLTKRLGERKAERGRKAKERIESTFAEALDVMESDPGFQAAARKRQAERQMAMNAAGPQLFEPKDPVVFQPTKEDLRNDYVAIPPTWVGTIIDHEWYDEDEVPQHYYNVRWKTPKGQTHEGFYSQDHLRLHPSAGGPGRRDNPLARRGSKKRVTQEAQMEKIWTQMSPLGHKMDAIDDDEIFPQASALHQHLEEMLNANEPAHAVQAYQNLRSFLEACGIETEDVLR